MGANSVLTGDVSIQNDKAHKLGGVIHGDVNTESRTALSGDCTINGTMTLLFDSTISGNMNLQRLTINSYMDEEATKVEILSGKLTCQELRNSGEITIVEGELALLKKSFKP